MLYNGEKLLGAQPDKFRNRLGEIKLEYDRYNRPYTIFQQALAANGDTFVYLRYDVTYNVNGRVDTILLSNNETGSLKLPFIFKYSGTHLSSISRNFNFFGTIRTDTTSFYINNEAGDITGIHDGNSISSNFDLSTSANTLGSSIPVWLLLHMLNDNGKFYITSHPFYANNKLINTVVNSFDNKVTSNYFYKLDARGNVILKVLQSPIDPSSPYDSTFYTYY